MCHNCGTPHPSTDDEIAANLEKVQALVDNEKEFGRYALHGFRHIAKGLQYYARGCLHDSEITTDESVIEEIQWELCELVYQEEYDAAKMVIMAFRDFIDLDFFATENTVGGKRFPRYLDTRPDYVPNRKHSANYPMLALTLSDVREGGLNYRGINSMRHPDVTEMFDCGMGCFLVRHGANPNLVCTGNGMTVLHCIANNAQPHYMQTLLALGADPNFMGHCGMTPLHMAAAASANRHSSHDRLKCMRLLLDHGASVDVRTARMGYTPDMIARFEGNGEVEFLVERYKIRRGLALALLFCYDQQQQRDGDVAMTSTVTTGMTLPDLSFDIVKIITLLIRRDY